MAPTTNGVALLLAPVLPAPVPLAPVPLADALLELDDEDEQPPTASAAKAIAAAAVPVPARPALPKNRVILASLLPGDRRTGSRVGYLTCLVVGPEFKPLLGRLSGGRQPAGSGRSALPLAAADARDEQAGGLRRLAWV
ncbi:MAG TPA: hypothetical protein VI365_27065 [Trebonia sp.]